MKHAGVFSLVSTVRWKATKKVFGQASSEDALPAPPRCSALLELPGLPPATLNAWWEYDLTRI